MRYKVYMGIKRMSLYKNVKLKKGKCLLLKTLNIGQMCFKFKFTMNYTLNLKLTFFFM